MGFTALCVWHEFDWIINLFYASIMPTKQTHNSSFIWIMTLRRKMYLPKYIITLVKTNSNKISTLEKTEFTFGVIRVRHFFLKVASNINKQTQECARRNTQSNTISHSCHSNHEVKKWEGKVKSKSVQKSNIERQSLKNQIRSSFAWW